MTASGVQSGLYGNVTVQATSSSSPFSATGDATVVTECTGWTISRSAALSAWASNKTKHRRRRVAGVKDETGSISGVYDVTLPIESLLLPGDRVYVRLYLSATKGHKFYVRLGELSYDVDIEGGEVSKWSCNWEIDDPDPQFNVDLDAVPEIEAEDAPDEDEPVHL